MSIPFNCHHCGQYHEAADADAGASRNCTSCGQGVTVPGRGASWSEDRPADVAALGRRRLPPLGMLLLVLGLAGCVLAPLMALLLPAMNYSRERARQMQCLGRLADIANAMHSYEQKHGTLPPSFVTSSDGRPWHSWRVLLLPYLNQQALFDRYRFDEPWDGPHNRPLHDQVLGTYHCPSDDADLSRTSYFVVVGPGTMFETGKKLRRSDAIDGQSTTLLVVEAAGENVHWMEPRDLSLATLAKGINAGGSPSISSRHPGLVCVAFVDGAVQAVADDIAPEVLSALLTRAGRETVPPLDAPAD